MIKSLIAKMGKLTLSFSTNLSLTVDLMIKVTYPAFNEIERSRKIRGKKDLFICCLIFVKDIFLYKKEY